MKNSFRTVRFALVLTMVAIAEVQSAQRWDFDRNGDRENWIVPSDGGGVVMGGSLWLTLTPKEKDPWTMSMPRYQIFGDLWGPSGPMLGISGLEIRSPDGLSVPPAKAGQLQVRLKLLNLSPATDLMLKWRGQGQDWAPVRKDGHLPNSTRCPMKSDRKEWQNIVCYIDKDWQQLIDQVGIIILQRIRGDIWFDSLEIVEGPPEPERTRPDIASTKVIPSIALPSISQSGFADAFKVMDECLITEVPIYGFTFPVIHPGGDYREGGWWEIDSSVTLGGAKWANQKFAENVMRGFRDVQAENPDGRIDLWGRAAVRGQVADLSELPVFFPMAFDIARRTMDRSLREDIYRSMKQYLDWWLSPVKRDTRTGLISGIFEDTYSERDILGLVPQTVAPVDTNVTVAIGARLTADLALALGKQRDARHYSQVFRDLVQAINDKLWDEQDGAYYNYDLRANHLRRRLAASTFYPLRLGIAPPVRRDRLLNRLLDPTQFNWGKSPLTSLAMVEGDYVEHKGSIGPEAWFGNVWTLLNLAVIAGLEESDRPDLAAELNWATIKAFHANYHEYLNPSSGEGHGVERYAYSASHHIEAIIEHLFGIDFDAIARHVRIAPHVPRELYGHDIRLEDLILPTGSDTRLSVHIRQSSAKKATIRVWIKGKLPAGDLQVALPSAKEKNRFSMRRTLLVEFK